MGDERRRKAVEDVRVAFQDAVRAAGGTATVRRGLGERVEASDVAKDVVTGTAANLVINHAKTALCRGGYITRVTCQSKSDTEVDFIFDVNSKRVVVGVQITF